MIDIVKQDKWRKNPKIAFDYDMMRVVLDMPIHTWRELHVLIDDCNTCEKHGIKGDYE
jgi:hypothetical protein